MAERSFAVGSIEVRSGPIVRVRASTPKDAFPGSGFARDQEVAILKQRQKKFLQFRAQKSFDTPAVHTSISCRDLIPPTLHHIDLDRHVIEVMSAFSPNIAASIRLST